MTFNKIDTKIKIDKTQSYQTIINLSSFKLNLKKNKTIPLKKNKKSLSLFSIDDF